MEMRVNSVKKIIRDYKVTLAIHYPDQEIMNMIYLLFDTFMGWPKTMIHLSPDEEIPKKEMRLFEHALQELGTGKPIQYVLGWTNFNGISLKVNSHVLIPRPETEELCRIIKSDLENTENRSFSLLDVGTGSGCIALDLKSNFPDSQVTGIDASQDAIGLARLNASDNFCEVSLHVADILNPSDCAVIGMFDVIVSNPPYVTVGEKELMHKNVLDFEPASALFVPDDDPLLFYRAIANLAVSHLYKPGRLYFEINKQFGTMVCQLIQSFGFEHAEPLCDIHGKERFVRAILKSA